MDKVNIKLKEDELDFIKLIERSYKGREWCTVSDTLWNYVQEYSEKLSDYVNIDIENQKVQLKQKAKDLLMLIK